MLIVAALRFSTKLPISLLVLERAWIVKPRCQDTRSAKPLTTLLLGVRVFTSEGDHLVTKQCPSTEHDKEKKYLQSLIWY